MVWAPAAVGFLLGYPGREEHLHPKHPHCPRGCRKVSPCWVFSKGLDGLGSFFSDFSAALFHVIFIYLHFQFFFKI